MVAGVAAAKDIKFVRKVLAFIGAPVEGPTMMLIDNEGMWFNVRNDAVSKLTRHWEIWQGFVRECYHNKVLEPMKIMDEDEMADVLSKALPTGKEKNIIFRKTCMNMQE